MPTRHNCFSCFFALSTCTPSSPLSLRSAQQPQLHKGPNNELQVRGICVRQVSWPPRCPGLATLRYRSVPSTRQAASNQSSLSVDSADNRETAERAQLQDRFSQREAMPYHTKRANSSRCSIPQAAVDGSGPVRAGAPGLWRKQQRPSTAPACALLCDPKTGSELTWHTSHRRRSSTACRRAAIAGKQSLYSESGLTRPISHSISHPSHNRGFNAGNRSSAAAAT